MQFSHFNGQSITRLVNATNAEGAVVVLGFTQSLVFCL
jgi:hypothetical protein